MLAPLSDSPTDFHATSARPWDIRHEAIERWVEVDDIVEAKARELATVLTRTDLGELFDVLS